MQCDSIRKFVFTTKKAVGTEEKSQQFEDGTDGGAVEDDNGVKV